MNYIVYELHYYYYFATICVLIYSFLKVFLQEKVPCCLGNFNLIYDRVEIPSNKFIHF